MVHGYMMLLPLHAPPNYNNNIHPAPSLPAQPRRYSNSLPNPVTCLPSPQPGHALVCGASVGARPSHMLTCPTLGAAAVYRVNTETEFCCSFHNIGRRRLLALVQGTISE